jgi:hypothetical protein
MALKKSSDDSFVEVALSTFGLTLHLVFVRLAALSGDALFTMSYSMQNTIRVLQIVLSHVAKL